MMHEKIIVLSDGLHQTYHVWDGTEAGLRAISDLVSQFYLDAEQEEMGVTIHVSRRVYHLSLMDSYVHVASLVTSWSGVDMACTAFHASEWMKVFEQHIHFTPAIEMARAVFFGRYIHEQS